MNLQTSESVQYKQINLMKNMKAAIAKKISNMMEEKQRINVPLQEDFIEQNIARMNQSKEEEDFQTLWNQSGHSNSKVILEGVRTPFIQQKLVIGKESNIISQGQMCEYKQNLFVGCKDGTIRTILFKPNDYKSETPLRKWFPHENNSVRTMSMSCGLMITNSNDNILKIWDIEGMISQKLEAPESILTIEGVYTFEIRQSQGQQLLSYSKENIIETIKISKDMDGKEIIQTVTFDSMKAEYICCTEEQGTFAVDNIRIMKKFNEEISSVQERPSTQKIKALFIEGNILVSISSNSLLQLIDLTPPPPESEEELKEAEDQEMREGDVSIVSKDSRRTLSTGDNQSRPSSRLEIRPQSRQTLGKQGLQSPASAQVKKIEETEEPEISNVTTVNIEGIGECLGVFKSYRQSNEKNSYVVSGTNGVAVVHDKQIVRTIKTEFNLSMAILTNNDRYLVMIGTDGRFRSIDWTSTESTMEQDLKASSINEAVSSANSQFFAILTNNQRTVQVFKYSNLECICKLDNLDNVFLINFSANSKVFIIVYNDTETDQQVEEEAKQLNPEGKIVIDKTYMIYLIGLDAALDMKDPPFRIRLQDYPYQIDTCVAQRQVYALCRSEAQNSSSLYTFDYNKTLPVVKPLKNIVSMVVSPDEKLLAYADNSGTIFMNFINKGIIVNEIKTLQIQNEIPTLLRFFENQKVLVAQTAAFIYGLDAYTHKVVFKISHSTFSMSLMNKIIIIDDEIIASIDAQQRLCLYDISTKYPEYDCKIISKPLKRKNLHISDRFDDIINVPWASIGYHLIMELENSNTLLFQKSPFLHKGFNMEDCLHNPFEEVDGFYIPITMGGPILSTGSFADIYNRAFAEAKSSDSVEAVKTLQSPIYPFKLTSLHFFALTHNVEGTAFCFKKRVRWINDIFGKSPLDYALESGDRQVIETVIQGLFETQYEDREAVMRELPLHVLLKYAAVYLPPLLREAGSSVPDDSKFCEGASPPTLFPLKRQMFGESSNPIYDLQIKEQLHPDSMLKKKTRNRAISTLVMNNPVPVSYCDDSLDLLSAIVECKSDEVVRSKPITLYLNRKWKAFAYRFYLTQFTLFVTLLLSLTFIDTFENQWAFNTMFTISFAINLYFFFYECVQMCIQKLSYFSDVNNVMDVCRLTLIFIITYSKYNKEFALPDEILPITFMLMWVKILSYFSVFKPTRYLIKMIFEIIADILTFLIILFTAIFAYAQINYSIKHAEGMFDEAGLPKEDATFTEQIRIGYAMAYGDLGNFMDFNIIRFIMFCLFSFFIPLVLLNMLIALMSDSYARVQTNAVAADCRALAELELELEELVYFFYSVFKPQLIANKYYYCFCSMVNDGDDDEGWEGTVGQLKATIKAQSEELQAKVIESVNESIKEKTAQVLDKIVKTNSETQNRIDSTQKLVEKETKALNENVVTCSQQQTEKLQVQEQTIQAYQTQVTKQTATLQEVTNTSFKKVNELINENHSKQEKLLIGVGDEVKTQSTKIITENDKKTSEVMKTIDITSAKEAEKVEQNVNKQSVHHKEMVGFAVTSQNKVNDLLQETSDQQKKLLVLIDELKEIQRKELESIAKQEEKQHQEAQLKEQRSKMSQEERKQQDAKASGIAQEIAKVQQIFTKQIEELNKSQVANFSQTTKEIQALQKNQEKQQENVQGDLKKVLIDLENINALESKRIKQQEISERDIHEKLEQLSKAWKEVTELVKANATAIAKDKATAKAKADKADE